MYKTSYYRKFVFFFVTLPTIFVIVYFIEQVKAFLGW